MTHLKNLLRIFSGRRIPGRFSQGRPVNWNDVVLAAVEVPLLEGLDPRGHGPIGEAVNQDFGWVSSEKKSGTFLDKHFYVKFVWTYSERWQLL